MLRIGPRSARPTLAGYPERSVIDPTALRRRAAPIDRSSDRLVALGAIAIAVAFLFLAVVATFPPVDVRRGAWLPLHIALAGAATTAIAGVMPFFAAAFAAAPPSDARLRAAAVGAVAVGAAAVSFGVVANEVGVAVAGGIGFVAGIALTGTATVRPLGRALGPSRGLVTQGYVAALAEVAVGASLATLFVAGWPPIVESWARVKPAHAWLNLVGFVSLVIATTLLHFFPTVVGARIALRPSARVTVAGLAVGAAVVAVGFILASDPAARIGALGVIGGACGLAIYAWRTWQTRAHWTSDPGWHRFAMGGLVSAIAWFEAGILLAAVRVLVFGADPAGWSVEVLAGPLVIGWVGLAIVSSATHLLPAVGPGDPISHARQRRLLGRAVTFRLVALDVGILALAVGLPLGLVALGAVGAVLVALGLGVSAVLLGTAVTMGVRRGRA
jgi:nitrite reductase (NO-forming)